MWCNRFNCDPSIYTNTIDSQATLTSYQTHSYIIIIVVHGSAVCTNSSRQIFLTSDKRSFPVMLLLTFFPKKRKKETTKKKVEARALPWWEATCLPRPHLREAPGRRRRVKFGFWRSPTNWWEQAWKSGRRCARKIEQQQDLSFCNCRHKKMSGHIWLMYGNSIIQTNDWFQNV